MKSFWKLLWLIAQNIHVTVDIDKYMLYFPFINGWEFDKGRTWTVNVVKKISVTTTVHSERYRIFFPDIIEMRLRTTTSVFISRTFKPLMMMTTKTVTPPWMMITVLTLSARTHVLLNILLELLDIYVMDIGPFSELNVYIIETESFHFLLQIMTSPIW